MVQKLLTANTNNLLFYPLCPFFSSLRRKSKASIPRYTVRVSARGFQQKWNGQQWRRLCDHPHCSREAQKGALCATHQVKKNWRPRKWKNHPLPTQLAPAHENYTCNHSQESQQSPNGSSEDTCTQSSFHSPASKFQPPSARSLEKAWASMLSKKENIPEPDASSQESDVQSRDPSPAPSVPFLPASAFSPVLPPGNAVQRHVQPGSKEVVYATILLPLTVQVAR